MLTLYAPLSASLFASCSCLQEILTFRITENTNCMVPNMLPSSEKPFRTSNVSIVIYDAVHKDISKYFSGLLRDPEHRTDISEGINGLTSTVKRTS